MRRRILVVDDELGPRESLGLILKSQYNVATAASGPEALRMLPAFAPDVAIVDIKMPEMDGLEVLRRIKNHDATVEVIMVTAYASVETAKGALSDGAAEYLIKPFSVPDLDNAIRRALLTRREVTGTDGHVVRLIREMRVLAVKARSLEEAAHQEAVQQSLRVTQLSLLRELSQRILGDLNLARMMRTIREALRNSLGYDEASIVERIGDSGLLDNSAAVVCPLRDANGTLGFLVVDNRRSGRPIERQERELLEMLAASVGIAIANARLYDEAKRRRREAEVIADLARDIDRSLDLDTILQRVAAGARDLCQSDIATVALPEPGADTMVFRHRAGARDRRFDAVRIRPGQGMGGCVLMTGQPLRTDNYAEDSRFNKELLASVLAEGVVAALVVPIRSEDRIEGLLYVTNRSPRPFTDQDEKILQRLADQTALAIKNARLFGREQAARSEAEATAHALQASEERYRALVEGSIQGMYIHQDRIIRFANGTMAKIFGYAHADELVGQDYLVVVAPPEHPRIEEFRTARLRGESAPTRYEAQGAAKDGRQIWIEILVSVIPWNGRPAILGTFLDISDRKRAQAALDRLSRQHELILRSAGEGIFGQDSDGVATFINPAAAAMLGRSPEEVVGKPMHAVIHHSRRDGTPYPRAECPIYAAFRDGHVHHAEHDVFWRRDGTSFPVEYTTTAMRAEDGQLIGSVVTFRDVSEREQLEAQIRQAQKMEAVGQLAAGIAHDFNNLLTVITGRAELLRRRLELDAVHARDFDLIERTTDRAAALIQQLLAFGRKQVLQPRVLDLNAVVADISAMLHRLIGEQIELRAVTDPALGRVTADLVQIEQVIVNLAVNARDAMPEGGRLTLRTANVELNDGFVQQHPGARPGPHVLLAVSDTGTGMDADTQARVFEPFFTTKGSRKGSGLGLSTVYGIVRQSNGYVAVESAPGRGSTFTIYLPRVEGAADT